MKVYTSTGLEVKNSKGNSPSPVEKIVVAVTYRYDICNQGKSQQRKAQLSKETKAIDISQSPVDVVGHVMIRRNPLAPRASVAIHIRYPCRNSPRIRSAETWQ